MDCKNDNRFILPTSYFSALYGKNDKDFSNSMGLSTIFALTTYVYAKQINESAGTNYAANSLPAGSIVVTGVGSVLVPFLDAKPTKKRREEISRIFQYFMSPKHHRILTHQLGVIR